MKRIIKLLSATLVCLIINQTMATASSHREAPLISNDPLADNTDVYAFKSPTDSRFTASGTALQFIPNMDGFPNGRRLEDDVTTIELQAVGGVVLAAIGLWYDDYTPGQGQSPVTPQLMRTLSFNAGPTKNDTTFRATFPFVQTPWRGFDYTLKPRF